MNASFSRTLFQELPIVGILRGFTMGQMTEIVRAALRGGLRNIEITMNTPDAARQLARALELAAATAEQRDVDQLPDHAEAAP